MSDLDSPLDFKNFLFRNLKDLEGFHISDNDIFNILDYVKETLMSQNLGRGTFKEYNEAMKKLRHFMEVKDKIDPKSKVPNDE